MKLMDRDRYPHPVYELHLVVIFISYDPKDTSNAVEFGGLPSL